MKKLWIFNKDSVYPEHLHSRDFKENWKYAHSRDNVGMKYFYIREYGSILGHHSYSIFSSREELKEFINRATFGPTTNGGYLVIDMTFGEKLALI